MLTLASVAPLVTRVASSPRPDGSRNHDDVTPAAVEDFEAVAGTSAVEGVFEMSGPDGVPAGLGEVATGLAPAPVAGAIGRRLAVDQLRQAILAGEMAPGQRLVEEELAG